MKSLIHLLLFGCYTFFFSHICSGQLYGESLDFKTNGNSYVQFSGDNDFGKVSNFQGEFTFEAWVLSEGSKTWSRVFDFGDSTNDFIIFTTKSDNGECEFSYRTGGASRPLVKGGVFPTGWTHVACTLDSGGQATIYLNGEIAGTTDWNRSINDIYGTTKSYLGKSQYAHDPYFEGKMDEVRVWKEARTQAEIQEWMNCELAGDNENLIGYFNMNQGLSTGPNTSDNTINNFGKLSNAKGTLYNFPLVGDNGNWVNETPITTSNSANNCFELDGTDGFKLSNWYNHDFTTAYTIEYWYKPNVAPTNQLIISKGDDDQNNLAYYMNHIGPNLYLGQETPSYQNWAVAYNVLELGKWQHIAGVTYEQNGDLINEIYVNGVLVGQKTHANQSLTTTLYEVRVGRANNKPVVGNVNGKISNLRLWNKPLEGFEIAQNMSTNYLPGTEGLVSQYNNYENINLGLLDGISNSHGIALNTPYFSNDPCFVQFKQQPEDQEISVAGGETITFTAEVEECNPTYTYQWQKDGSDILGANNQTYVINAVSNLDQGVYTLNVTACDGQIFTTRRARLTGTNPGTVLSFDGKDDYMEFDAASLVSENAYTIETWVRFKSSPKDQNIIVLTNDQGPENYYTGQIRVNAEGYVEHSTLDQQDTKTVVHPEKLQRDQWYHLRATAVNGGIMSISINGNTSPNTLAISDISTGGKYMVGHPACGHGYFDGDMGELRIWKIDTNTYDPNPTDLSGGDTNLLHYYDFNKGVAYDDNSSLTNDINDPYFVGGNLAALYNFSFNTNESNWTGCGPEFVSELTQFTLPLNENIGAEANLFVFSSSTTGDETFQWYKDEELIEGATNSTYIIDDVQPKNIGNYYATMEVPGQCKSVSQSRYLNVNGSGEVLNFDGVDDHLILQSENPNSSTIMMWVKLEGDSTYQNIIQGSNGTGPFSAVNNQLYTDGEGNITFYASPTGNTNGLTFKTLKKLNTNQWYHIALTQSVSLGERSIYVDGAYVPLVDEPFYTSLWSGLTNYYIGSAGVTSINGETVILNHFKGEMEEIRIYNRALSSAEILSSKEFELYSEANIVCGCTGSDPLHYLKFNQGLADGNNQNLTNIILDYDGENSFKTNTVEAKNFSWSNDESNWSNCSPITKPVINFSLNGGFTFLGSDVELGTNASTDTSLLDYQWRKDSIDIIGAIHPNYIIEDYSLVDSGFYDVIVSDYCSPINIDTINVGPIGFTSCFDGAEQDTIDYPAIKSYMGCTDDLYPECGESFFVTGYCDSDEIYAGKEWVYKLEFEDPAVVQLDLHSFDSDLDMFVLSNCNIDQCYGSSTNDNLQDERIIADIPEAGLYFIIIDTKAIPGGASTFTLDVEIFDSKCYEAEPLECGITVSANTSDGTPFISSPCGLEGYSGNEKIYEVSVDTSSTISALLTNMSANLDLFLLDSLCRDITCVAQSTNGPGEAEQIIQGVEAGTYYLVVDGADGSEGTFDLTVDCKEYFEVSVDDNDAYIDLDWSIDKSLCVPQDTGIVIRILTTPSTILYEEEFTTAALTPDIIQGTYRHYVGTNHTRLYKLRVYNRLSNKIICDILRTGSTTEYRKPDIVSISDHNDPDSIRVTWRNLSKLSDHYRVYRDGVLIKNLTDGYTEDSLLISIVDIHDINSEMSIQQDSSYQYCIEAFSLELNQAYADTCAIGSTFDINFQASDLAYENKVVLNWENLMPFCDMIKVERNDIFLATLSNSETTYSDTAPIYGVPSEYSITLMVGSEEIMEVYDTGSVNPHGVISGKVLTQQGDYPIANANVILSKELGSSTEVIASTVTDFTGKYRFEDIVYGLSQDFKLSVNKTGSTFDPDEKVVTLNEAIFEIFDLNFEDILPVTEIEDETLVDDFNSTIYEMEDYVTLEWNYTYDTSDTLFFNLYRNGKLILDTTDASGMVNSFDDFSGVPDSTYQYILQIHSTDAGEISSQQINLSLTYPSVTPLSNMDIILGEGFDDAVRYFDPSVILDWSNYNHPSLNFDGFKIFRDGIEVGEIDKNGERFSHLIEPGSTALYQVEAFRVLDGIIYQSEPYPLTPMSITANDLWSPNVGSVDGRNIELNTLDLPDNSPAGGPMEFYTNATYEGVSIERKLQSEDDSTYVYLDEFKKSYIINIVESGDGGLNPLFRDIYGVPGADYTYRLSTYTTIDDSVYYQSNTVDIQCPAIEGPSNLTAIGEEGKVELNWTSNQASTVGALSLGYINYEGYELTRTAVGGGFETLIATLAGNKTNYSDFISNPVYDIFFDVYDDLNYEYTLKAFLDIDGTRYYADPISVTAMPTPGDIAEPLPFNFVASQDLPNHVKLCWDWTATKQNEFVIFRDSVLVAILPHTARSFYDYDATPGVIAPYTIQSRFEGIFSQQVRAEGLIPSFATISGRVYNSITGEGLANVNIDYSNQSGTFVVNGENTFIEEGFFKDATQTDATGRYNFEGVPNLDGLELVIDATRINTDFNPIEGQTSSFATETINISEELEYEQDFIDYSSETLPEGIAQVTAVSAESDYNNMNVQIHWSINNNNYDGFKIYRGDNVLGEVMSGDGFVFIDSTAFPGIQFPYGVQAFQDSEEGRVYTEIVSSSAIFPAVPPVINLTVTAFAEKNLMKIAWSHPLDNHDLYTISRNGIFMTSIETGTPLMWYDSTGIPGINYNYEVIAVNGNFVSDPVAAAANYKGVGEVTNLNAITYTHLEACPGTANTVNYIDVRWNYMTGAADGFEVYRDDELIAEIDSTVLRFGNKPLAVGDTLFNNIGIGNYRDYTGVPGTNHTYHVLAYVEREGGRYTSGIEELYLEDSQVFPNIAKVEELNIAQNNILGSVQITFNYELDVVKGFEILRDGIILDTIFSANNSEFIYQDINGSPGQSYQYAVRAYDVIKGINYYSDDGCETIVDFPIVPVPQSLFASQGEFNNHIEVRWLYDLQSFVDSFHLENITLGTSFAFANGSRAHIDVANNTQERQYEYRIRASRAFDGSVIYSDWSDTVIGWAGKQVTGNEDNEIHGSCYSNLSGYSVDIDGEWAVSGTINGEERVDIYRMIDGGWSLFQTIISPLDNPDSDFGYSVAISDEKFIVGAPLDNKALVYQFDGTQWGAPQALTNSGGSRYGHSVDINIDKCVISDPLKSFGGHSGEIQIYELESGIWDLKLTHDNSNTHRFGYGLAIEDNKLLASFHWISDNAEGITTFTKNSGVWSVQSYSLPYTENNELTNDNIDVHNDYLIIGDIKHNSSTGLVSVINLSTGVISSFIPSGLSTFSNFGKSVAIRRIPSPVDDVTYIAVGAPDVGTINTSGVGKSYLLSDISGSFQILEEYQNTFDVVEEETSEQGGWSVSLSQTTMMIGTPYAGIVQHGEVDFHNLLKAPSIVTATDGISSELDPTRVTIDWTFDGNKDLLQGFNIYRDDEFLIYRDKGQTTEDGDTFVGQWEDNTVGAGQPYVYSVRSVNDNIPFESYNTSDEGYTTANGKIQGSVTTAGNNVAVPGVEITATGIVDGEVYTYTGTTFSNGEYILTDVYYDHDEDIATEYVVTANYLDHIINPVSTNIATLNSLIDPTVGSVSFIDETAFVIYGKVEQPMVACAIEGIKVTPIINGTPNLLSQTTTDADGNYSLVVNPNDPSLISLAIRIENQAIDGMDTLQYGFKPDADTLFTNFVDFPFAQEINYTDTLTYPVSIRVKNTCDDPISISRWDVRIRTLDGCFDEVYQTNTAGNLEVELLPLNYEMKVVATDLPSTVNQVAIDYFSNFPVELNLFDLHRDSLGTLTKEEISDLAASKFTYHVAPDIAVTGFTDILCDTEVAILQQGDSYTLNFDITEQFGTNNCPVQEGKIRILNPASDMAGTTEIPYDDFNEQFGSYTFTAGNPNQIRPHFYTITIDYLSDDDVFLGRTQRLAFVEGAIGLPGAGIVTDPVDGNNAVPLPIMVLRDPPGDGSSSYISGGQSVTFETELVKEFGGQTEISVSAELELFSANTEFGFTNVLGGSDENTNTYTNTLTLSQTISTFDPVDIQDETLTGVNADIVVGQGLVMSFGKVYEYSIECGMVNVVEKNRISPGAASTTWHYTVSQINNIILGFENDSLKIQNGTLVLQEGNRDISREESLEKIATYLDNWRQVLRFHSRETLPMYNLCTTTPPIEGGYLGAFSEIQKWKTDVCAELGSGLDATFSLNEDITWSDPIMDKYNAAILAIRNLSGPASSAIWNHTTNYNHIINTAATAGQISSYGMPVENITVGGGIAIERSLNNVSSSTRSHVSNFYTTNEVSAAAGVDNEVTIVVGAFAGVGVGVFTGGFSGVLMESSVVKTQAGLKGTFEFKKSNKTSDAIENEIETGYTLSDDDSVDAFSVTVVQPIAQNHTPYFDFFGGFTSCPAEDGAIAVDNPKIAIVQGGGTTDEILIQNVAEDELVQLDIIIESQTPISSQPEREVKVYLDAGTNLNGALLTLNGVDLNNGEFITTLDAFDPVTLSLTIERGPLFYEYDNLQLVIEPTCDGGIHESVDISVRFNSPCSPVTLVEPVDDWLINDNVQPLVIAMQDYDPYNEVLEKAVLEYRKIGESNLSSSAWNIVNNLQILQGNEIPADSLAAYNEALDATIQNPKYYFTWNTPEDFVDGEYEVRVRMKCDFSNTYSNAIRGTIARNEIGLNGLPQPADQVWTDGDEISFGFNLPLDCGYIQGPTNCIEEFISIIDETTGMPVEFSVSCFNNKLEFVLNEEMSTYDGHFLTMHVDEVPSETGNISEAHEWTFRVITQKVYWANGDTIKLRMYQDESTEVMANLVNNDDVPIGDILSLVAADGALDSWIQVIDPTVDPFDLSTAGRTVAFGIDASIGLGTYNETINVDGVESFGNTPQLHFELEVLNRAPNWVVDPNDYSQSMNIVANWKFDDQGLEEISIDTTDIISVWIESEIRGVANIISADGFHYAYITVYGDPIDANEMLEFRIWDGDPGIEYDGHALPGVSFVKDTQVGTVGTPVILNVNAENDLARYIPLNGNGSWTGFSLFTNTENMTVEHKLRSLKYEMEGDIILTGNKFAQYNDSIGWYSFGDQALAELNTSDGYMIYLQGAPDTLRVSGAITSADNINLINGWNWMGFPFETGENVNLSFTYPAANGLDKLKKDTPLPGASNQNAQYNPSNQSWQGNMPTMEPNNLYKLYISNPNPTELDWLPDGENANEAPPVSAALGITADPDDETTWTQPAFNSDAVMPVIAQVISGGIIADNPNDRVAIFENDTLRGFASPIYLPEFDTYQFSLLIESGDGDYDIKYYDAEADVILTSTNILNYNQEGEGTYDLPYEILFDDGSCPTLLILGPTGTLFDVDATYEAGQIIRVRGSHIIPTGVEIIFDAPRVIFEGEVLPQSGSNVIVKPDGCN